MLNFFNRSVNLYYAADDVITISDSLLNNRIWSENQVDKPIFCDSTQREKICFVIELERTWMWRWICYRPLCETISRTSSDNEEQTFAQFIAKIIFVAAEIS